MISPAAEEVSLAKNILLERGKPLSWEEFSCEYAKFKPGSITRTLQDTFCQTNVAGMFASPDFISLDTPEYIGLLKLQLIVEIHERFKDRKFSRVHHKFLITATEEEKNFYGRKPEELMDSMCTLPTVFCFSSSKDEVYLQSGYTPKQNSFFMYEGDDAKLSAIHKLRYFLYLSHGASSDSAFFEFAHCLLTKEEKKHYSGDNCGEVMELMKSLNEFFQVVGSTVKLVPLSKPKQQAQNVGKVYRGPSAHNKIQKVQAFTSPQPAEVLTADFVKNVLNNVAPYPMDWNEFKTRFLKSKQNSDGMIANFLQHYPQRALKSLCFSSDFLALNTPFHRNRLKLQLILAIRRKSAERSLMSLANFKMQFEEIASEQEIEQTELNYDFRGFLNKFPGVFVIRKGNYVKPGRKALQFPSFFQHEKDGPLVSVAHKLNYFVYLCGDYCSISLVCKFLQRHLKLKREFDLVNTDEKVLALIQNCESGALNLDGDEDKENLDETDTSIVSCAPEKNCQQLEYLTEGNSQSSPSTQGNPASSSTSKVNLQSVPPKKDYPQPSSASQEAESTSLKSAEVTFISSCKNLSSEINRLVKVKIVRTDKILTQVMQRMLNFERPVMSMVHREDALVILNPEGKGFVIPYKKTDLALSRDVVFAQKWSLLAEFFQNPKVTPVTFDCQAIGRFILENFNLQLNDTVFDVKIGAELLPSECNPTSVNNVADLCRCLNLPSLDKVDVQIVGDLVPKQGEEMVTLEKSSVTEAVREASALIPGIYGKIFQSLQRIDALKTLHKLTGDKLQSLYSMNVDSLLPLDKYYTSVLINTEPMKQISSQSSVSTGSSVPVSSVSLSGMVSSQISSVDPTAKPPPSGYSEVKGSAEDCFSTDGQLPTIPSGIKEIFNQNQFSAKPSLLGTPLNSYLQNQTFSMESLTTHSLPQGFMSNQQPHFEQSMLKDHPLSLCKDDAGNIIQVPVEEAGSYDQNLSGIKEELVNDFASQHTKSMLQLLLLLGMDIFETLQSHYKENFCNSFIWLTEIVLDLGRNAEARFFRHSKDETPETVVASSREVTAKDLAEIEKTNTLSGFGDDNRCGLEGTLHSLRQVRNKKKRMVGLTVRVHKPLLGCADMMYDIALNGKSTLIIGYPGVGKTTLLRELARCLNDSARKRVIVVDTYNEIAGDYDVPHFSIGGARRLQVDSHDNQYKILLESAKNHCPEVLIVDKIESQNDVEAVVKLCKQGIQVIAGVDTESISNLFNDKNFYQLFQNGGDNRLDDSVSLDSTRALAKSKVRPSFQALVEMVGCSRWYVHDLAHTYNCCLSRQPYSVQERTRISFKPGRVREQQILLQEILIV